MNGLLAFGSFVRYAGSFVRYAGCAELSIGPRPKCPAAPDMSGAESRWDIDVVSE